MTITNNQFTGGGIYNYGVLTLNNSFVDDNSTVRDGGGIENRGTLYINSSSISNNTAGRFSAGIGSVDTAIIRGSIIDGNISTRDGAGIYNNAKINNGVMEIYDTAITNNASSEDGGGIFNDTNSPLDIYRSTLSGNSSNAASNGSALYIGSGTEGTLENVTISGNSTGATARVFPRDHDDDPCHNC